MGNFRARMRELGDNVGDGDLVGTVEFAGPHAAAQHEGPGSRFAPPSWEGKTRLVYTTPATGPNYLGGPLLTFHQRYLQTIADELLRQGAQRAMFDAMGDLKDYAKTRAPKETGDLAGTGRARVTDNGANWVG